jgi:hypothetical protein
MNRFTLAVALAVAIASVGCAEGVEDPQQEETTEAQRPPPSQLRSGEQVDPLQNVRSSVDEVKVDYQLPPKQPLPGQKD